MAKWRAAKEGESECNKQKILSNQKKRWLVCEIAITSLEYASVACDSKWLPMTPDDLVSNNGRLLNDNRPFDH